MARRSPRCRESVLEVAGVEPELPASWSQAFGLTQRMAEAAVMPGSCGRGDRVRDTGQRAAVPADQGTCPAAAAGPGGPALVGTLRGTARTLR